MPPVTLDEIRAKIDGIDSELLRLLNERADLVHAVGEIKKAQGLEIFAPEREVKLVESLLKRNRECGGRLPGSAIRAIYREIMSAAKALEQHLRIAYLGPPGTWAHQAALNKFGASVECVPQLSPADVFDQVERRRADYGVVPIENSSEGASSQTLDLFAESPLKICAQIQIPVENCLISRVERPQIAKIYSHPAVFAQCRDWLRRAFPHAEKIEASSTTRAAELAAADPAGAALAGALAAELHGMAVLEQSVQDSATNTTRFLVLSHKSAPPTGNDRTSLMFSIHDRPGALFKALEPFNQLHINMSKIESRPARRKDWAYFFFVDVMGHTEDAAVQNAIAGLEGHTAFLKVLGSYPNE
ncbi:MAG: prephenate dehydratase [Verrucomicrobiales bacterium]